MAAKSLLSAAWAAVLALLAGAAQAQQLPTPAPLTGAEWFECWQSHAAKACTPAGIEAYLTGRTNAWGQLQTFNGGIVTPGAGGAIVDATTPGVGSTGGVRVRAGTAGDALIQFTSLGLAQWGYLDAASNGSLTWNGGGPLQATSGFSGNLAGTLNGLGTGTSGANLAALNAANIYGAKQSFAASTAAAASVNVPPGTVPSSPLNGDIWATSSGVYAEISGSAVELAGLNTTPVSVGTSGAVVCLLNTACTWSAGQTFGGFIHADQYSGPYTTQVHQFGGQLLVTGNATINPIVGAVVQDGSNGNSFPTGVTGYGLMNNAGNQAFGVYGQCDLGTNGGATVNGTCTNEFDSFNYSGTGSIALPPNLAFGTNQNNAIAMQLAAYGNYPSSLAFQIAFGSQPWENGIYINPQAVVNNALYIDATATHGANTAALLRATPTGNILILQTEGGMQPQFAALAVQDQNSATRAAIKQIGDFWGRSFVSSGVSAPTISTCTGLGSGGGCALESGSSDGAGTIVLTTGTAPSANGTIILNFSSSLGNTSSSCIYQLAAGATGWAGGSFALTPPSGQSANQNAFTYQNGSGAGSNLPASSSLKVNYFCTGH